MFVFKIELFSRCFPPFTYILLPVEKLNYNQLPDHTYLKYRWVVGDREMSVITTLPGL